MSSEPNTESGSVAYDDQLGGYRLRHDRTGDVSLSTAIVCAISDISGTAVEDLDPLYEVVDPDALDDIFAPPGDGRHRTAGGVWLYYHGYRVIVYPNGEIRIEALDDSAGAQARLNSFE